MQGHESVGRKVAFQPLVRNACRGSSSCGFVCPPPEVGGRFLNIYIYVYIYTHTEQNIYIYIYIYTEQNAWVLLGASLVTRCPQRNSLSLLSILPACPLPPATSSTASQHRVPESEEKGRLFWEHIPVCCQLCWRTWSLSSQC